MISRHNLLARIRGTHRVQYDALPAPEERIDATPDRPGRLWRSVPPPTKVSSMPQDTAAQPRSPGLTPTQDMLVNRIPRKYTQPRHAVRSFIVNHVAERDPQGLVQHLARHFDFPVRPDFLDSLTGTGPAASQRNTTQIHGFLSKLEHEIHRGGNKNFGHDIMKSIGDYLDYTNQADHVLTAMQRHFGRHGPGPMSDH